MIKEMPAMYAARLKHIGFLLLFVCATFLASGSSINASPAPPPKTANTAPDMIVMINATSPGVESVGIAYPGVASKSQTQSDVQRLMADSGWQVSNLVVSTESGEPSGKNPITTIEFTTSGTIDWRNGDLKLAPFIDTFKNAKNLVIIYLVPQEFPFAGIRNFENRYVSIALSGGGGNMYQYSVTIKDHSFQKLDLPIPAPRTARPASRRGGSGLAMLSVVLLALVTAVIAYLITDRLMKKRRQG